MAVTGRVAVLSKKDLPYARWMPDADVVVFAQDDAAARGHAADPATGYHPDRLFEAWKTSRLVDLAVLEAHRRVPFDRIVALSECDQVRAGELRDRLGLPGRSAAGASVFRDKVAMKAAVAAAGLTVPECVAVDTPWDVPDLARRHRRVVVKPRDGSGARGVRVLGIGDELDAWLAARPADDDEPTGLVAEEWVGAPMLLVDGVMAGGRVLRAVTSRYDATCHEMLTRLCPQSTLHLARDDPASSRAMAYTEAVVAALGGPAEPTSFHCELFDDPRRGPLLCEIACRTGGGGLNEAARAATGVDLERWSCLGQAGECPDRLPGEDVDPGFAGTLLLPRPGRTLVTAPRSCPVPGVLDYRLRARDGEFVPRARKASECVVEIVFAARRPEKLESVHGELRAWLDREVVWA